MGYYCLFLLVFFNIYRLTFPPHSSTSPFDKAVTEGSGRVGCLPKNESDHARPLEDSDEIDNYHFSVKMIGKITFMYH